MTESLPLYETNKKNLIDISDNNFYMTNNGQIKNSIFEQRYTYNFYR
jgi:hypothetical protein